MAGQKIKVTKVKIICDIFIGNRKDFISLKRKMLKDVFKNM